jgi:cellulose synthase/poly-beta-1,6-N-acetylglucosamine synthase-like glycosyltransferase
VIIAAWREASTIGAKLADLARQRYPAELVEVIVACDGSDDGTPAAAARAAPLFDGRLRVLALANHRGKAAALNAAVALASGEILVFTDARQTLDAGALAALVESFADAEVGAVAGELRLVGDEVAGAYWRYEAALRRWEAAAGSCIGVSGALYALRRQLWRPLPLGTILDDLLVPMRVRLAGRRVALDARALAFDRDAPLAHEFRRKVRTLSGNWQLLLLEPALLSPWRNPSWLGLVSHKLMRLLAPYALLVALVASARLPSPWSALLVSAQLATWVLALARRLGWRSRLGRWCQALWVLNAAALLGGLRFLVQRRRLQW